MKNLIVGQGLAGTVLAFELLKRGEEVLLLDNSHKNSSSMVAAGLWNPIVFRKITKSWLVDELTAEMHSFYSYVEEILRIKLLHQKNITRIHASVDEINLWTEKCGLPLFENYLQMHSDDRLENLPVKQPFGNGQVTNAGYLDLPLFLQKASAYFLKHKLLVRQEINLDELEDIRHIGINEHNFDRVILCQGYQAVSNNLFSYLPFKLAKGEVLTIYCPDLPLQNILNAGFFLLPLGENLYKLGATFEWEPKNTNTTEEARNELLSKFKKVVSSPFQVIDQQAGIRPTIADRRPLLGEHPEINGLYIFNGLGTKGVMLAPYFASKMADLLISNIQLPDEVDIRRFNKRWRKHKLNLN